MRVFVFLAFALGLFACMNREDAVVTQPSNSGLRPGSLRLAPMASAKTAVHAIPVQDTSSPVYDFDLGAVNSSAQRFFILKNTGDYDVHDIVLTTDNPHFYFSPSRIKVLQPSKNASVLQVITLNVLHGNRLDGVGFDSLLPMGENGAAAHIAGGTVNGSGDSLSVAEDVDFHVFANVLDVKIYGRDATEVDMSQYLLDFGPMKAFTSDPIRYWDLDTVKMVNTGNSPFTVRFWHVDESDLPVLFDSLEVQSGESFPVSSAYIEIDGHGVISNPSKPYLQPARNGRIYMDMGL